jgi:hypothetical protein
VYGPSDIVSDEELEITGVAGGSWTFSTPMGMGAGPSAAECLQGAQSDVLPTQIKTDDLRTTIPVGTLLCTETSEGNLAMLKVTDITTGVGPDLPDYATELTLWRKR